MGTQGFVIQWRWILGETHHDSHFAESTSALGDGEHSFFISLLLSCLWAQAWGAGIYLPHSAYETFIWLWSGRLVPTPLVEAEDGRGGEPWRKKHLVLNRTSPTIRQSKVTTSDFRSWLFLLSFPSLLGSCVCHMAWPGSLKLAYCPRVQWRTLSHQEDSSKAQLEA